MEEDNLYILIQEDIKENGKMGNKMVKESYMKMIRLYTKVYLKMECL